jgi:hypothetical protein
MRASSSPPRPRGFAAVAVAAASLFLLFLFLAVAGTLTLAVEGPTDAALMPSNPFLAPANSSRCEKATTVGSGDSTGAADRQTKREMLAKHAAELARQYGENITIQFDERAPPPHQSWLLADEAALRWRQAKIGIARAVSRAAAVLQQPPPLYVTIIIIVVVVWLGIRLLHSPAAAHHFVTRRFSALRQHRPGRERRRPSRSRSPPPPPLPPPPPGSGSGLPKAGRTGDRHRGPRGSISPPVSPATVPPAAAATAATSPTTAAAAAAPASSPYPSLDMLRRLTWPSYRHEVSQGVHRLCREDEAFDRAASAVDLNTLYSRMHHVQKRKAIKGAPAAAYAYAAAAQDLPELARRVMEGLM